MSNAVCRVNRQAVLEVADFAIHLGEHWCLFGENGSGKTQLASLLSGQRRESGSYVHYGDETCRFDPLRDCLFVSFEEQQKLWEKDNRLDMSEYDARAQDRGTLVSSLITSARSAAAADDALLQTLIDNLQLGALLEKGIRFLSSGQLRKVLIARALYGATAGIPKLIVLDDPMESIDRLARESIAATIAGFQRSEVTGKLFATLLLCRRSQDILDGTTHIALMDRLRILEQGPRQTVMMGEDYARLANPRVTVPDTIPATAHSVITDEDKQILIELRNVSASYGELEVFSNLYWSMHGSDHVLIEGPNGCGKSTLLSLIDGENHKAYGQEVILFGRRKGSGESIWDVKANFGVVSNELHNKYIKGWKVLDVVVSGFYDSVGLYDDSGSAEWDRARAWLSTLGIAALEKAYYHELSFGQQRLVLLARAMVKEPRILILDEPCVGLDDYHRRFILGTLDRIAQQTRTRLIYVSHVAEEQPSCINYKLSFVPKQSGGFAVEQGRV
ncbi:MAG: ATP-binding cassette domain-containing protein [Proteobacteria bacterium]|nr:ATP-binding cassette domain-containing protein [Pseudomonadota bacterium]